MTHKQNLLRIYDNTPWKSRNVYNRDRDRDKDKNIANLGNSRVVLGTIMDVVHAEAEQLTLVQQFPSGRTFLSNYEINELMVKGFSKVCFFTFNFLPFSYFCCKLI